MDSVKFCQQPQKEQERLRDVVYCAFEGLIRAIASDYQQNPDAKFQLVYDLSEEYSERCLKLFLRLRSQAVYKQFFPVLTFADDQEFPPLQVADMLAYCRREEVLQGGAAHRRAIVKRMLEIFSSGGLLEFGAIGYRGGSALGNGVLRSRS